MILTPHYHLTPTNVSISHIELGSLFCESHLVMAVDGKPDAAVAAMEYLDYLAGKVAHGDEEQADEDDRAAVPTLSPYQFTVE